MNASPNGQAEKRCPMWILQLIEEIWMWILITTTTRTIGFHLPETPRQFVETKRLLKKQIAAEERSYKKLSKLPYVLREISLREIRIRESDLKSRLWNLDNEFLRKEWLQILEGGQTVQSRKDGENAVRSIVLWTNGKPFLLRVVTCQDETPYVSFLTDSLDQFSNEELALIAAYQESAVHQNS